MFDHLKIATWRHENKFVAEVFTLHEIEHLIRMHPLHFSPVYHLRRINNLYLDTIGMQSYLENSAGISQRVKYRLRWYGDDMKRAEDVKLELKVKSGHLGGKIKYSMPVFDVADIRIPMQFENYIRDLDFLPPLLRKEMLNRAVALFNTYERTYFVSHDGKFRITLDFNLRFGKIDNGSGGMMRYSPHTSRVIIELKYDQNNAAEAEAVTRRLPFRVVKNSKYAEGIKALLFL